MSEIASNRRRQVKLALYKQDPRCAMLLGALWVLSKEMCDD